MLVSLVAVELCQTHFNINANLDIFSIALKFKDFIPKLNQPEFVIG